MLPPLESGSMLPHPEVPFGATDCLSLTADSFLETFLDELGHR